MVSRISVSSTGVQSNGSSSYADISSDGRYVVYSSVATNLISNDTNSQNDIFLYDSQTATTTCITGASNGSNGYPSISGDGRYITYYSSATNLVSGDTNSRSDVFLYDTQTATTTRISVASNGTQSNNSSQFSTISADGRYITYTSDASNLVSGDTNNLTDLFLYDTQTATTTRINVASNGTQASGGTSYSSVISDNGRYITYQSSATNLVSGDTNAKTDVFLYDTQTATTTRISVASNGAQSNDHSSTMSSPSISSDGRYVIYQSNATNLVSGDTFGRPDIFLYDTQTATTTRVNLTENGTQTNGWTTMPQGISADGKFVVYYSDSTSIVSNDTNATADVFLTPTDTTAPVFASATVNGTSLVLSYTEAGTLDAAHAPATSRFAVTAGGAAVTVNSVAVDAAARTVTLTLASAVTYGQTVTVGYTDPSTSNDANAIQDAVGNDAATIAGRSVTNATVAPDTTAPVFAGATVNGSSLVLSYTEANSLDATNLPATSDFTVTAGGAAVTVSSVAVDAAARTVTLTLASAVTHGQSITVGYTDPTAGNDGNAIQDAAGNDAATITGQAVTNNTPDTTAPVFASATVDGALLVLSYTEANGLDATNLPATSAFTVTAGGTLVTVSSAAVDAAAETVTLTLARAVTHGQIVIVGYTDPTAGNDGTAIQDAAGNDAATIAGQAVTNNTASIGDGGGGGGGGSEASTTTVGGAAVTTTTATSNGVATRTISVGSTNNGTTSPVTMVGGDGDIRLSAALPGGVSLKATGPVADHAPGQAGVSLANSVLSLVGDADQRAALDQQINSFTQSLPADSQVTVNTLTPTISGTTAPDQPIVITGGSTTEAVILDLSQLPPGTRIQVDNVAFLVIIGQGAFTGGAGQNYAVGDGSSQTIILGADDDITHGGGGDDHVGSLDGNDRLYGDDGNDTVSGGADDDALHGGSGNDSLDGGLGTDIAVFSAAHSSVTITGTTMTGEGTDTLTDVELLAFSDGITLVDKQNSGSFDEDFYLAQNADIAAAVTAGLISSGFQHFSLWGGAEGRDANPLFDASWYLEQNLDIAAAVTAGQTTAWQHYTTYGWKEDRDPSQYFDTSAYLTSNQDVNLAGVDPLDHFLSSGAAEGRMATATAVGTSWLV